MIVNNGEPAKNAEVLPTSSQATSQLFPTINFNSWLEMELHAKVL